MMAVEALAILAGRDPDDAQEGPAHRLERAEPAHRADRLEALRGLLEEPPRRLGTDGGDEARGRRTHLAREDPRKVTRAHRHAPGQRLDREVVGRVVEDMRLEVAQRL